jgi:hypothetical protein
MIEKVSIKCDWIISLRAQDDFKNGVDGVTDRRNDQVSMVYNFFSAAMTLRTK